MITIKDQEKIRKDIEAGIWKTVRLLQILPEGQRKVCVQGSKTNLKQCLARLDFIISQPWPAGEYELEVSQNHTTHALRKQYPFTVKPKAQPVTIHVRPTEPGKDSNNTSITETNAEAMYTIDPDRYQDLIEENARLKGQEIVLRDRIKTLEESAQKHTELADNRGGDTISPIATILGGLAEGLIPIAEKLLEQRDRSLSIKESQLSSNGPKLGVFKGRKKKEDVWNGLTYDELVEGLESSNEDQYDQAMTQISKEDPELYEQLCNEFHGGEEEEEEEPEGEEDAA